MSSTRRPLMVLTIALVPLLTLIAAEGEREGGSDTYFSKREVSRYFEEAQEAKATQENESHLRKEAREEVVDLAPMTVRTDDSPLLLRIRRRIEMGPESVQRRLMELSPMLARDAEYDARAADRFFTEDPSIGPAGAGAPARVDFVPILKSAGKAVQEAGGE